MENVSTVKMIATAQYTRTKSVELMEGAFKDKITLDIKVGCAVYCPVFEQTGQHTAHPGQAKYSGQAGMYSGQVGHFGQVGQVGQVKQVGQFGQVGYQSQVVPYGQGQNQQYSGLTVENAKYLDQNAQFGSLLMWPNKTNSVNVT